MLKNAYPAVMCKFRVKFVIISCCHSWIIMKYNKQVLVLIKSKEFCVSPAKYNKLQYQEPLNYLDKHHLIILCMMPNTCLTPKVLNLLLL